MENPKFGVQLDSRKLSCNPSTSGTFVCTTYTGEVTEFPNSIICTSNGNGYNCNVKGVIPNPNPNPNPNPEPDHRKLEPLKPASKTNYMLIWMIIIILFLVILITVVAIAVSRKHE